MKSNRKTIEIAGMKDSVCVQKVIAILRRVSGVTIEGVQVGSATITCGYPAALAVGCASLTQAGYRSHEAGSSQPAAPSEPAVSEAGGGTTGNGI